MQTPVMGRRESRYKHQILNAGWWVRHYRGRRNRTKRAQAIAKLAAVIREVFEHEEEDPEEILKAIVDSLRPEERDPF